MYAKMDLVNPAAIIDANHSNSGKQFKEQIRIVKEVMHNRQLSQDIHNMVKGVMIESYIEEDLRRSTTIFMENLSQILALDGKIPKN